MHESGLQIEVIRSTQNKYYYDGQIFDEPEIKLLIDAVSSSKFITEQKSEQLINKLLTLVPVHIAVKLRRHIYASDRVKSDNERGYYIVDVINEANHSRYLKNYIDANGQLHYMSLITDEGTPDWVRGEWSSYTSPKLLEEFGAEIGYKVKSLYNAYPSGSEEWYQYHYYVQAIEDGELYSICHVSETNCYTGIRSRDNIPKIDFANYQKYFLRLR